MPRIYNFRPFTNLFVLSTSLFTKASAYLDNWVNLWSYWDTFIWLCHNSRNSDAILSLAVSGIYFSVNLFTKSLQVIGYLVLFTLFFTVLHQCSASFWNMKEEKDILCSSVQFITSKIFSIWRTHASACKGSTSPSNTGDFIFQTVLMLGESYYHLLLLLTEWATPASPMEFHDLLLSLLLNLHYCPWGVHFPSCYSVAHRAIMTHWVVIDLDPCVLPIR